MSIASPGVLYCDVWPSLLLTMIIDGMFMHQFAHLAMPVQIVEEDQYGILLLEELQVICYLLPLFVLPPESSSLLYQIVRSA